MNSLTHLDEFKAVLADYHMSEASQKILNDTRFVALAAISSTGRNTIIRELVKTGDYHFIISDTTRKPRRNDGVLEQDGVEYWFRSEEDVLKDLRQGRFAEAALIHNQQVSGVSIRELEVAHRADKIAISDIEPQGVHTFSQVSANLIPIFLLPPSYAEWRRRLNGRGKLSEREIANRVASAKKELKMALKQDYYHFLVNDELADAIKGVDKIAHGVIDHVHEEQGQRIALELLHELEK